MGRAAASAFVVLLACTPERAAPDRRPAPPAAPAPGASTVQPAAETASEPAVGSARAATVRAPTAPVAPAADPVSAAPEPAPPARRAPVRGAAFANGAEDQEPLSPMDRAREAMARGDTAAVVQALEGRARTPDELRRAIKGGVPRRDPPVGDFYTPEERERLRAPARDAPPPSPVPDDR